MEKHFFLGIMIFVIGLTPAIGHDYPLCMLDSSVTYDCSSGECKVNGRIYYSYDSLGQMTSEELWSRTVSTGQWKQIQRIAREYNTHGKLLREVVFQWQESMQEWIPKSLVANWYYEDTTLLKTIDSMYSTVWEPVNKTLYGDPLVNNLDTISHYYWLNGGWVGDKRKIYGYNPMGNRTIYETYSFDPDSMAWLGQYGESVSYFVPDKADTIVVYQWLNGGWKFKSRELTRYDTLSHTVLQVSEQTFDGGAWQNSSRSEYNYTDTLLDSVIHFNYDSGAWEFQFRDIYLYDSLGNVTAIEKYIYSNVQLDWNGISKDTRNFDQLGNLTSVVVQLWNDGLNVWENGQSKTEFTYYPNGSQNTAARYLWDNSLGEWLGQTREITHIEGDVRTSLTRQIWDSITDMWLNVSMDSSRYDHFYNEIGEMHLVWDNATQDWVVNKRSSEYPYKLSIEQKGNLCIDQEIELSVAYFFGFSYQWFSDSVLQYSSQGKSTINVSESTSWHVNARDAHCTYMAEEVTPDTCTGKPSLHEFSAEVYPTITTGIFNIKMKANYPWRFDLCLLDNYGRCVWQDRSKSGDVRLNISDLPSGTYLLKICTEGRGSWFLRKIIKH